MSAPRGLRATARVLIVAAAVIALRVGAATADSTATALPLELGAGSVLSLEGTSTVHDFECRSTEVEVSFTRDPGLPLPADAAGLAGLIRGSGVRGVEVRVPVKSLRSGKAALDKNLRKAMRAEQHPRVVFVLSRYTLTPGATPDDTLGIRAEGSLTVAGTTRPVTLEARAHRAGQGIWLVGQHKLRMSEYGIRPPTMMLGALRVGDPITVRYRLQLVPKGEGVNSSSH